MSDEDIISLSDVDSEGDGPGIKPPQSKGDRDVHSSGGSSSKKKHKHHKRRSHERREERRQRRREEEAEVSRNRDRSERRDDHHGSREDRRDRYREPTRGRTESQDLRNQLFSRQRLEYSRDRIVMERDRSDQQQNRRDDRFRADRLEQTLRKNLFLKADQHREESRRNVDVRKRRKLIEKEMEKLKNKLGRKMDAGRTGSRSRDHKHKSKKKSEDEEESMEDDSEDESGSGEVSDTGESEEDSGSDAASDATTGSQKSKDTPDRDESESDDEEQTNAKESDNKEILDNKSRWADDRSPSEDRTPSRSPTPMREPRGDSIEREIMSPGLSGHSDGSLNIVRQHSNSPSHNRPNTPQKTDGTKTNGVKLPPYFPSVHGCRSIEQFQKMNRIEEGTYGVVYRARDLRTEEIVALKKLKMEKEKEGFPITSLREINTLLIAQHKNVVTVREIVFGNLDQIYIVMDFVEHDLKGLMETMRKKNQVFLPAEVKCLMEQLLRAVHHLHDNWILHRDLKASNLLLSHNGILKVGDFGLAREYGSPLRNYTAIVVTLWYRAPELLLGMKPYSTHIDVWSIGCIFGELLLMEPLFPGKSEVDELNKIFKLLGTPSEKIWPGYKALPGVRSMKFVDFPVSKLRAKFPEGMLSEGGLDLMKGLLTYDPTKRMTCEMGLKHRYFDEMPRAIDPSMFPTWPAKSEQDPSAKSISSPKPPSGGGAFKNYKDDDEARVKRSLGFDLVQSVKNNPPTAGWNLKF